jgi:probable HAF family extracellular repeat protein
MSRLKNTLIAPSAWLSTVVLFLAIAPLEAFGLTFTKVDVPGAIRTLAIGINASGDIVGWFQDPAGIIHGFRLSDGIFTTIDAPGATHTAVLGINARGQIIGHYVTGEKFQAFCWRTGTSLLSKFLTLARRVSKG